MNTPPPITFNQVGSYPRHVEFPDRLIEDVKRDIRTGLAERLMREKLETIIHDDCVEMRLSLIVASHDEFWAHVRKEAQMLVRTWQVR